MSDKPKRPGTHRDVLRPKTPPLGVRQQLGTEPEPTWLDDTGVREREDDTPVGLETLDAEADMRLRHRVKETNATTRAIKETAEATHTGVDTLRFETKKDVQRLDNKIGLVGADVAAVRTEVEKLDTKIDQHTGHVIRMVEVVGELKGTVGELVKNSDANRERQMLTFEAHVEVDKTAKVTAIADAADSKKAKRERVTKLVAGVVTLLTSGAVIGYVVTHLSC